MLRRSTFVTLSLFGLALAAGGCDTDLPKANPYDPDLPVHERMPATLVGEVFLEAGDPTAATVEVRPAGLSTRPDAEGGFEFQNLPPGTYSIVVTAESHSAETRGGVYCAVGARVDLGRIALVAARGGIQGLVVLEDDAETEAVTHGGALIFARRSVEGRLAANDTGASTTTNPTGAWLISGLPVGTYQVDASRDGFAPAEPVEIQVLEDRTTTLDTLRLRSITSVVEINGGAEYANDPDGRVTVRVISFETDTMQISEDPEFGDAQWQAYEVETTWDFDGADGERAVYMRFANDTGYETQPMHDTIIWDTHAPEGGRIQIAEGAEYVQTRDVYLDLYATDPLSGVALMRVSLDGEFDDEPELPYNPLHPVQLPLGDAEVPDGLARTVWVMYADGAGNWTAAVSDTVLLDSTIPQNASVAIEGGAAIVPRTQVTLTLVAAGATEMKVSNTSGFAGVPWQPFAPTLTWLLTPGDELKTVYAMFRDAAKNETAEVEDSIELNTRGEIRGVFLLEGAGAEENADINVEALGPVGVQTTTTAVDGSFVFSGLPVGSYSLLATCEHYNPVEVPYVELGPGGEVALSTRTLSLKRGTLSGSAQRQGAGDDAHGGILVEVLGSDFTGMTSATGAWSIAGIPEGQYTVRATAAAYTPDEATDVDVVGNTETTVAPLRLAPNPGSVVGQVAVEDLAAPDLGGVNILVGSLPTATQDDGSFEVLDVTAGTYAVKAQLEGYKAAELVVLVEPGVETDAGTLSLTRLRGTLAGTATLEGATTHGGILVEVTGTPYSTLTGATGAWTLAGIPVGEGIYTVRASLAGYAAAEVTDLSVVADTVTTLDPVELAANPGSVVGSVGLEGQEAPALGGVAIRVGSHPGTTQNDGSFAVDDVPPGSYTLTVTEDGYVDLETPVEVLPGAQANVGRLALVLARGSLSGMYTKQNEIDHAGILVEVVGTEFATLTANDGSWTIAGLPTGRGLYTARASAAGYTSAQSSNLTVNASQTTAVPSAELAANPGTVTGLVALEGKATGEYGGVGVVLEGTSHNGSTSNDGSFSLSNVLPGTYTLTASLGGFSDAQVVTVVSPGKTVDVGTLNLAVARGDLSGQFTLEGAAAGEHGGILVEVVGTAFSTISNPDGDWGIGGVPAGTYAVRASAAGYNQVTVPGQTVTEGQATVVPAQQLTTDPGRVLGSVAVEGLGAGFLDANIALQGTSHTGTSDSNDGSYTLTGVPAGTYTLTASKADYATEQATIVVKPGTDTLVPELTLRRARGTIEGTATLVGEDDHSGITVEIDGTGYAGATGSGGSFRIPEVPTSVYSLTARKEGFIPKQVATVVVDEDTVTFVDVGELGRQQGDFVIQERALPNDQEYLNSIEVELVFEDQVPDERWEIMASEDAGFAGAAWVAFAKDTTDIHPFDLAAGDPDGTRTVYVKFRDNDTPTPNETAVFASSTTLDREAPLASSTITINSDADFTKEASGLVSLTLAGLDATSGVAWMMISRDADDFADDSYVPYTTSAVETVEAPGIDGLKTIYVRYMDRAGNETAVSTDLGGAGPFAIHDQIYLDTEPPGVGAGLDVCLAINDADGDCTTVGDDAAFTTDVLVTLSLLAMDACTADYPGGVCTGGAAPPASMMLANDGAFPAAVWEPYATSRAWFLTPGDTPPAVPPKEVFVQYMDAAGNATVVEIKDEIRLDRQAPSGTATIVEGAFTNSADVELRLTGSADTSRACVYGDGVLATQVGSPCDPDDVSTWEAVDLAIDDTVDVTLDDATDGEKVVKVRLADPAGNRSDEMAATTTLDTQAPEGGSLLLDGGATDTTDDDGKVDLTLFAYDTLSGMASVQISNDGTFDGNPVAEQVRDYITFYDDWVLDGFAANDGVLHTVYVRYGDKAGNWTIPAVVLPANEIQDSITLDNVDPTADSFTMVDDADGDEATTDLAVTLNPAATGATQMKISHGDACSGGTWEPVAAPKAWTLDGGGDDAQKYSSVVFRDDAGNLSGCLSDDIFVDTVGPEASSITIDNGAAYNTSAADSVLLDLVVTGATWRKLSWTADLSGVGWTDCGGSCAADDLAFPLTAPGDDGDWTIYGQFRDDAGNTTAVFSDGIVHDATAPTGGYVVIDGGAAYCTDAAGQVDLALGAVDDTSGVSVVMLSNDGVFDGDPEEAERDFASLISDWPLASPASVDGQARTVYVRFGDRAGNWTVPVAPATEIQDGITLDNVAPTADSFTLVDDADGDEATTDLGVTLTLTHTGATEMKISHGGACSGGSWEPVASPKDWTLDGGGDNVQKFASLVVRDDAGNVSAPCASDDIYVDTVVPEASSITIDNGATYNTSAADTVVLDLVVTGATWRKLSWTADLSGVGWTDCGGSCAANDLAFPLTAPGADGDWTIYGQFRDDAGNTTAVFTDSIIHDATAPTDGFVSVDGGATYSTAADGKVDLSLGAADATSGLSQVKISNTGAFAGEETTQSYATVIDDWLLDGVAANDGVAHTVYVRFSDRAGNWTVPVPPAVEIQDEITLDNVRPTVDDFAVVDDADDDESTNDLTVKATLDSTGATEMKLTNGQSCVGGGWEAVASPSTWTLDGGGDNVQKHVSVVVRDAAGNESTPCASDDIYVDDVAPQVPSLVIDPDVNGVGALYNNSATHDLTLGLSAVNATHVAVAESPDFSLAGWTACGACDGTLGHTLAVGNQADGEKTLYVKYRDAAGNESSAANDSIIHDITPPDGGFVLIDNDAEYTNSDTGAVDLYLGATDALSGMGQVAISNTGLFGGEQDERGYAGVIENWVLDDPGGPGDWRNGLERTVYVRFQDRAGNWGIPATPAPANEIQDAITLDNETPTGAVVIEGTDGADLYTNSATVSLDFTAAADVVEVAVSNTDTLNCDTAGYSAYTDPLAWTLATVEGVQNVYTCFRDAAHNWVEAEDDIILDMTAPQIGPADFAIDDGAGYTNDASREVALAYWATDLNGPDHAGLADGAGTIFAANEGTFSNPVDLGFDASTDPLPNTYDPWTLTAGDGEKFVYLKAVDRAGNARVTQRSIVLDTSGPEGASLTLDPTDYVSGDNVLAHLEAVGADVVCVSGDIDDAGGVPKPTGAPGDPDCPDLDSAAWQPMTWDLAINLSAGDGDKTVRAWFADEADNVTGPVSDLVTRDEQDPGLTGFTLTGVAAAKYPGDAGPNPNTFCTRERTVQVALTAADVGPAGLAWMRFWDDTGCDPGIPDCCLAPSGTWMAYSVSTSYSLETGDGEQVVCAQVADGAQNPSPPLFDTMVLDTTAPDVPLLIKGETAYGTEDEDYSRDRLVTLDISAWDEDSGNYKMRMSQSSEFSGASWRMYENTYSDWNLVNPNVPTCRTLVVINEVAFETAGPPADADNKIELYNATGMEVQLKDWTVTCFNGAVERSWTLPEITIYPWEYLALDEGSGTDDWNYLYLNQICGGFAANGAGAVLLRNAAGQEVDFVRWGGDTTSCPGSRPTCWNETPGALACANGCQRTSETMDRNLSTDWCSEADGEQTVAAVNDSDCGRSADDCKGHNGYRAAFVQVEDAAGNRTTADDDILLDLEPASGWFEMDDGAEFTTDPAVDLDITATDWFSGVAEASFTEDPGVAPVFYPFSQNETVDLVDDDRRHLLYMTLRDWAGNDDPLLHFARPIVLDQLPPVSPCPLQIQNGFLVGGTLYVRTNQVYYAPQGPGSVTDATSGVSHYQSAVDDPSFSTSTWAEYQDLLVANISGSDEGYDLHFRLKDGAGNEQPAACFSQTVQLDTAPPEITVLVHNSYQELGVHYVKVASLSLDVACEDDLCHQIRIQGTDVADGTLATGDWVDYASNNNGTISLTGVPAQGTKDFEVEVWVRDGARNISSPVILQVTVDLGLPDITTGPATMTLTGLAAEPLGVVNPPLNTQYTRDRTVTVDLADILEDETELRLMRVSEDGTFADDDWQDYDPSFHRTLSAGDGNKNLYVWVTDLAGNVSGRIDGAIELDTQQPIVSLDVTGEGAGGPNSEYTHERVVELNLAVNDFGGSGEYKMIVDNSGKFLRDWQAFASPVDSHDLLTKFQAGGVTVERSNCKDHGVLINEVQTGEPDWIELVNATGLTVDLSGWKIVCGRDTAANANFIIPEGFTLGPGEYLAVHEGAGGNDDHNLYYPAKNCQWENQEAGFARLRDSQDYTMDFMSFNGSSANTLGGEWFDDLPLLTDNGVLSRTQVEFDRDLASDWCADADTFTPAAVNDVDCGLTADDCKDRNGAKTAHAKISDYAGNEAVVSTDIVLDREAPFGSVVIDGGAAFTSDTVVGLTFTYYDNLTGTEGMDVGEVPADLGTWQDPVDTMTYTLTQPEGEAWIRTRFGDLAGNVSPTFFDTITLDTEDPHLCEVFFDDGTTPTNVQDKDLTINTGDATSGVTEIRLSEDAGFAGAPWQPVPPTGKQLWTLSATEGLKRVYIQCRDGAGHEVDGDPTVQVYYDPTPPSASYIEINGGAQFTNDPDVALAWAYTGDATKAIVSNQADFTPFGEEDPDAPPAAWPLIGGNGTRNVFLKFEDDATNQSGVVFDDIILDTTPPDKPHILALSPYQTSVYVDLEDAADNLSGVSFYTVEASREAAPFVAVTSVTNTVSNVLVRDLEPHTRWCFRAFATDNAGNPSDPFANVEVECTVTGFTRTSHGDLGNGGYFSHDLVESNGLVFFEMYAHSDGADTDIRIQGCDTRLGRCADNLFSSTESLPEKVDASGWYPICDNTDNDARDAYYSNAYFADHLGPWLIDVEKDHLTSPNNFRFNIRRCLQAWNIDCTDMDAWEGFGEVAVDMPQTTETETEFKVLGGAANGRAAYVFLYPASNGVTEQGEVTMYTCDLGQDCVGDADAWQIGEDLTSVPVAILFNFAGASSRDVYAGEHHIWLGYHEAGGVHVSGCLAREDCTDSDNWSDVTIPPPAGTDVPAAVQVLEADGYLRVLVWWYASGSGGVSTLYTCPVGSGESCTAVGDFEAATLVPNIGVFSYGANRGGLEAYLGNVYATTRDAGSLYLSSCQVTDTEDCAQTADWETVLAAEELYFLGDAPLAVPGGNPIIVGTWNEARTTILEPELYNPMNAGLGPIEDQTLVARWEPRPDVDGYRLAYDVGVYDGTYDNEVNLGDPGLGKHVFNSVTEPVVSGSIAGWNQFDRGGYGHGMVGKPFTRRYEHDDPVVSEWPPLLQIMMGADVVYRRNDQCRVIAWAADDGDGDYNDHDIKVATCPVASDCNTAAQWNANLVQITTGDEHTGHLKDLALWVDPAGGTRTEVWVGYQYGTEGLYASWLAMNDTTCALSDPVPPEDTNETLIAAASDSPRNLGLVGGQMTTISRRFTWAIFSYLDGSRRVGIRRCYRNSSNCDADGDWEATFDLDYEDGGTRQYEMAWAPATAFDRANERVLFAAEMEDHNGDIHVKLANCNWNLMRCNAGSDFIVSDILYVAGASNAALGHLELYRDADGKDPDWGERLVYHNGGRIAWCYEGELCGSGTSPGSEWQRAYMSPSWQYTPYTVGDHTLAGLLGVNELGQNVFMGTARGDPDNLTHQVLSRACSDRCWKLSHNLGSFGTSSPDVKVANNAKRISGHMGSVLPNGSIDFLYVIGDPDTGEHHWVFMNKARMAIFAP